MGGKPRARTGSGLFRAARDGDRAAVAGLLDGGARVDEQDERGKTPLFVTRSPEVAELLLERGADIDRRIGLDCESALSHAIVGGHLEVARLLLARGANYEPDQSHLTRVYAIAMARGTRDNAELALSLGVDIDSATRAKLAETFPELAEVLVERARAETAARIREVGPGGFAADWLALAEARDPTAAFTHHFAAIAESAECEQLVADLGKKVSSISVEDDRGELVLRCSFSAGVWWLCATPCSRALELLPPTYARALKLHNGIEHVNPRYTWGNIWLHGVGDNRNEISTPVEQRSDAYPFHPTATTPLGEPALGYRNHESDTPGRPITKAVGAVGHFLRIAGSEILENDPRCAIFPN